MNTKILNDLLTRGVDEIIDRKHLEEKLKSGKKLRIKLGVDPTGSKLHIGHAITLWKLKTFQDLGHKVVLIIGDFTAQIGDTSDKESERPMLTEEQVADNMKDYLDQIGKILDIKQLEVHHNSEWLKKLTYDEILKQADQFGLNEFVSRELIARRLKTGSRVSLRETYYPLLQGYDSVAIQADVEMGGTDQRFNLLTGRTLQKFYGQEPQDIFIVTFLEGLDGRKMSKTLGNGVNISDEPNDMFGKVMTVNDDLIVRYFTLATSVPLEEIEKLEKELKNGANPRDIKLRLAKEIVTLYHGAEAAEKASQEWQKVFSNKEKPSEIEEASVHSENIVEVLVETKLVASKSEAKRVLAQNGVKVNDQIANESTKVSGNSIIQVGKRKFIKIK